MAVFLLLVVIIALPSLSVVWFMTHAMENERLVVRQKLSEAYQSDLEVIHQRLQDFWDHRRKELEALSFEQSPPLLFREVVTKDLCDTALVYNSTGDVVYPVAAARMPDEVALTLRNEAAQLIKAGSKEEAIAILTGNLQAMEFRQAADSSGRLVCADALLLALRTLEGQLRMDEAVDSRLRGNDSEGKGNEDTTTESPDSSFPPPDSSFPRRRESTALSPPGIAQQTVTNNSDPRFATTLGQLKQLLNDYTLPYFPSRQRLFLMSEVMKLGAGAEFPTYQAELLAQTYLESATDSGLWRLEMSEEDLTPQPPLPQGEGEQKVPSPRGRGDLGVRCLFKPERMLSESRQVIGEPALGKAYEVFLESQTETSTRSDPFLSVEAPTPLPGYRLALRLTGTDPFETATHSQILAYRLAGGGVILVTLIVAVWIAYLLNNQIKLTRLRNDLIATVSHELRTPLASVRLLVDTLLDGRVSGEEATREYLGMISKESRRLSALIDNFLTFSRMERNKIAFERDLLNPHELIDSALESLSERFSRPGVQLSVQVASDLPPLLGDRDALVTLLVNLLDNAYKYTGVEKAVFLRASQVEEGLVIEVADNGIGIPRRAMRKIFKRFYQVDRSLSREAGGCGLGLAIVDFIVRGHQGQIRVESEVGKGSRFIVTLPALPMEKDNGGQDTGG